MKHGGGGRWRRTATAVNESTKFSQEGPGGNGGAGAFVLQVLLVNGNQVPDCESWWRRRWISRSILVIQQVHWWWRWWRWRMEQSSTTSTGGAGTVNTGGGGGGGGSRCSANNSGGAGGSGIVIIRYKFQNS